MSEHDYDVTGRGKVIVRSIGGTKIGKVVALGNIRDAGMKPKKGKQPDATPARD